MGGEGLLPEHQRVRALLERHGWSATSFQVLEPGYTYWFDGEDACVAYVDTGRAWVVAGAPLAPAGRLAEVVARFEAEAAEAGRRVCFFAVEERLLEVTPLAGLAIGEQPVWDPRRWEESLRGSRGLREQLRRARAKGVRVREVAPEELSDARHPTRRAVDGLMERWLKTRRMAPMGFLVQLAPYAFAEERRSFVAERGGEVVAFLSAVPVYARNGWFVEHLLRGREAPNGTTELLVDAAMRAAAEAGREYVTLGLAPLAGEVAGWLRGARLLGQPLYDFQGLWAFKRKLRPHRWERLHLAWPGPARTPWPVYDALGAFARGSLLRFALATLLRRPVLWVGLLALLLVPWTVLLSLPAHAHRFPAPWVRWGWVLFDVGLTGALFTLVRRWRPGLAMVLGSVIAGDACLTFLQAVLYNAPRARGPLDWFIICLAVLAPASASGLLFWAREHPTLEPG